MSNLNESPELSTTDYDAAEMWSEVGVNNGEPVTTEDRVDALSSDTQRDILVRIANQINANESLRCIANTLRKWSVID